MGVLAFFTGLLSLIHLPLNLKGRAEAHRSGLRQFSAVKTSAAHAMAKQGGASQKDYDNIKADYARAGQNSIEISEPEFLKQKQKHLRKVALSKALDKNPFANIMLMKVRLRFAHNRELLNGDIS
ncbi:hypothetical protein HHI_06604 [Hyphomonas hirschiana VP5]|uniref:Uncharacterized protein n=1 Tax=Hyphomonas hirschiana VP5 TaxID=1280951 RepID=A0A059FX70_9PROT|nr:hypothetical protein HHI_06604 [Hyphomonas hirschiana VP5]